MHANLALAFVALGRYEEARGPADLATDTYKKYVELLMAYGHVWEPVNPDAAQWAFHRAKKVNLDNDDARIAFDSLAHPLKGRGTLLLPRSKSSPPSAAAYRTMLRRVRAVLTNAWKGAAIAALCCGLVYLSSPVESFPASGGESSCCTSLPSSASTSTWVTRSPRSTGPCREACA